MLYAAKNLLIGSILLIIVSNFAYASRCNVLTSHTETVNTGVYANYGTGFAYARPTSMVVSRHVFQLDGYEIETTQQSKTVFTPTITFTENELYDCSLNDSGHVVINYVRNGKRKSVKLKITHLKKLPSAVLTDPSQFTLSP